VTLATLFRTRPSAKVVDPVYFGGPRCRASIFAVVRRDPRRAVARLFGDVFVTANANAVDRIIEKTPNDARYFAGFVGWAPGEIAPSWARVLVYRRARRGAVLPQGDGRALGGAAEGAYSRASGEPSSAAVP